MIGLAACVGHHRQQSSPLRVQRDNRVLRGRQIRDGSLSLWAVLGLSTILNASPSPLSGHNEWWAGPDRWPIRWA